MCFVLCLCDDVYGHTGVEDEKATAPLGLEVLVGHVRNCGAGAAVGRCMSV